jgi:hypothetical protein
MLRCLSRGEGGGGGLLYSRQPESSLLINCIRWHSTLIFSEEVPHAAWI